ncbi:hypothetical protein ABTZ03_31530 [Kitasatospora sp. NPDC096077]|uniref:hypothetical protein n=1 Tax=Kitasatospora sp. NPDC096077 TaxID=3155544 RepID=UPI00331A5DA4
MAEHELRHIHGALSDDLAKIRGYPPNTPFGPWERARVAAGWLWEQWRLAGNPPLPGLREQPYVRHIASVRALTKGLPGTWGTLQDGAWLSARAAWCTDPNCRSVYASEGEEE